jgi:mono/diheme cytochrome c family protein
MKWWKTAMLGAVMVCIGSICAQPNPKPKQSAPAPSNTSPADRGQQVFAQNCSRCHNAPEGFSPRISGTIAMHMRVRASLSAADEKALRHFLNP